MMPMGDMGAYSVLAQPGTGFEGMIGSPHDPNAVKRGLKLRITVEGKPASGCTVNVVNESGDPLSPYLNPVSSTSEGGNGIVHGNDGTRNARRFDGRWSDGIDPRAKW